MMQFLLFNLFLSLLELTKNRCYSYYGDYGVNPDITTLCDRNKLILKVYF